MRFVARVADNAPDKTEHQWFKIEKWPTIVRIRVRRPAFFDGLQQEWPTIVRKNRAPRQVLVDFYSLFHLFNR